MFDPNMKKPNESATPSNTDSSSQNSERSADSSAVWNGETYHSGRLHTGDYVPEGYNSTYTNWQTENRQSPYGSTQSQPPYGNQPQEPVWHQNTWQPPLYQDPGQKPPRRKSPKGVPTWVRVLAGVIGCFFISACSIGIFVGLVNSGVISFGSGTSSSAFSIIKPIGQEESTPSTKAGSAKLLTKQQVASKVIPSVVLVQNYQNTRGGLDFSGTSTSPNPQSSQNTSLFGGFGEDGGADPRRSGPTASGDSGIAPAGEGSGVIISSDGYIMTNAHVVDGAAALKVILSNNKGYEAKLIGSDSVTDLALIKINVTGLHPAEFGDSSALKIGDEVVAIGNPGGSDLVSSATFGNISALNRTITDESGYSRECIQTDAAINPGNSGGALANMYGQVIGINSSKLTQVGGISAEGLGFAIPINDAQPIISNLKQYGYVKDRAMLGISGRMVDAVTARIYGLSQTGFVIQKITNVELTKANVSIGDMITKLDGTTVVSRGTITSVVAKKKAGQTVTLALYSLQTGKSRTVTVKLMAQTGKPS